MVISLSVYRYIFCESKIYEVPLTASVTFLLLTTIVVLQGGGYGGGYGGGHGGGTACIVKGSYCQCHYCKCEKGHVSCKGYGHDKGYGNKMIFKILLSII